LCSAAEGGSINPSGTLEVIYGTNLSFVISPSPGYAISDVEVDNQPVGAVDEYFFDNIVASHSISARFRQKEIFNIMASAGTGGSITPSGTSSHEEGTGTTYIITPGYGFRVLDVVVDNHSAGPVTEYTFDDLTSNHNIVAYFTASIDIEVFPNPFTEEFSIGILTPGEKMFEARIADMSGRIIFIQKRIPGNGVTRIQFPGPKGIYFLRLYIGGVRIAAFKIIRA
jgi:hypothetical protein